MLRNLDTIASIYFTLYILENSIWKSILSQKNTLIIFPASIPLSSVKKILEANCIHKTTRYVHLNSLWITKLFINLANGRENTCLTIDCTGFNANGPDRFRAKVVNPDSQTCYFNVADNDYLCFCK